MAISDFVLLHNKAAEGLAKHDRVGYDILDCRHKGAVHKVFAQWYRRTALFQPAMEKIPGFLVDAKAKAKRHSPL